MTEERFIEIFEDDSINSEWEGDNAYQGLQILAKYTSNLIQGAEHDKIYSEDISTLVEEGITEEEALSLKKLNWMIEDDTYLACFV